MSEWPTEFPESCPPSDAEPSSGTVFRLVAGDPPNVADFDSVYSMKPARFKDRMDGELCLSMGLSVFDSIGDAERLRKSLPPFKNHSIALGTIAGSGLMKSTPSASNKTHKTWWRPNDDVQWTSFEVQE